MSNGIEAAGDIAQGALLAHAIEPATADHPDDPGHTHETACLNCATPLVGAHCHACGQAAHVHRSLGAFFHDLLHGVFHFEGKAWRTLPMLARDPGRLTREYIDGRRASYVSPIALFLFCLFVFFAVIHAIEPEYQAPENRSIDHAISEKQAGLAKVAKAEAALPGRQDLDADDRKDEVASLAERRASLGKDLATLQRMKAAGLTETPAEFSDPKTYSDIGWLDNIIRKTRHNPELVFYKLQTSAYKYAWALIPVSVPMLWLLFPFSRRFQLYDHTVFVTYSLCFMLLMGAALSVLGWAGLPMVSLAAMLIPPWHMYRQVRGTYGCTRKAALWRTWVLLWLAIIAFAIWASVLIAVGVAG